MKLKLLLIENKKLVYNLFWDTTQLIEYDLKSNDFIQKEVLFECNIPKFSKVIICPNAMSMNSSSNLSQLQDGSRVFCIGGYINEGKPPTIKAVNWTLEYVKEPCFI